MAENIDFTVGGNRKRPGYDLVASWVSQCVTQITSQSIIKSFRICGL